MVLVLGIETSCDETSAAVLCDGKLLSNVISLQVFHEKYGGVVPELASRAHQKLIVPVVDEALQRASVEKSRLDGVAATYGPGLVGSLLVGLNFGKALAFGLGKPFVGVNHMEAHIFSNFLPDGSALQKDGVTSIVRGEHSVPEFPFLCLVVSGGHTQLVLVKRAFEYVMLGDTKDDAAGEAFDKVAKMLGIGYPGGPLIDKYARGGNRNFVKFPRPYLEKGSLEFSFSGLKTSVLYYLKGRGLYPSPQSSTMNHQLLSDLCASFQAAVVDVLVDKTFLAAARHAVRDVAVAGGVAANSELRARLKTGCDRRGLLLHIPPMEFCTDNGAMIAMVGWMKLREGAVSPYELNAVANLELTEEYR